MNQIQEISMDGLSGGQSSIVSISGTSAQSAAIGAAGGTAMVPNSWAVVTPTVDCFFRVGVSPTALSDGTDQFLVAYNSYRIFIPGGQKYAFKTTGATGSVYITPGA